MQVKPLKILLAEDDFNLGLLLSDYLETDGFEVKLCKDGEQALKAYHSNEFDLCLLDVMMPKMDGYLLAKEIRLKDKKTPIIFISAKSLKDDKIKGYGVGADDYISKPFDEEELLCKIKALVRRNLVDNSNSGNIEIGKYVFNRNNQSLIKNGKTKRITLKECEILMYLFENRNRIVKREELLKTLWGENDYFLGRSLDVFISKIRKYLSDDNDLSIENVFGVGFIFNVKS